MFCSEGPDGVMHQSTAYAVAFLLLPREAGYQLRSLPPRSLGKPLSQASVKVVLEHIDSVPYFLLPAS